MHLQQLHQWIQEEFEEHQPSQWLGGNDSRVAGGVLVVSVINGELKEVCSAKVRNLGEKVGQSWRLRVHPQDSAKAAYVNHKGEVKWNLQEIEVPIVEQSFRVSS